MIGLRDECLRGKDQYRPRKGQEGPMETEMLPGIAAARPGQCICYFLTRIGGHVKVIPGRAPVHQRGTEGPIPIGATVPQGHRCNLCH
jgi:hypothetical protein